jgi:hypothetical protein
MAQPSMGRQIGEKAVRVSIAVVGLLILHAILSALPMLKRPVLYMPSAPNTSAPNLPATDAIGPQVLAQWQQAIGKELQQLGGQTWEYYSNALIKARLAIFPVTIANAVVDTLIFIVLILFGRDLGSIVRSRYAKLPDLGQMLNLGVITVVVVLAYQFYQGIFFPLLWPDNQDIYGWIFLALGLAPLVGIVVIVSRNMDAITGVVMHSGEKAIAGSSSILCGSCGQPMAIGTKFCQNCGAAANVPVPAAAAGKKFCSACGAENSPTAKFCKGCGQSLAS